MRMSPRLASCLLLVSLLSGCFTPRIHRFSTAPELACPGDEITLGWETNGAVHLEATPEVPGLEGTRDKTGEQRVTVQGPTRFQLEVTRLFGLRKLFTQQEVLSPTKEFEYGVSDTGETPIACAPGAGELEASLTLDDTHLSSNTRVGRITNRNSRDLVITQEGMSETLATDAQTPAFQGRSAQGAWRLRVPLRAGESCEEALESVSGRLIVQFQLLCPR